ncbi:MAG: NAD(P)-dependent oxidoreductase, partial [Oscillospiraceae bacterium]
MKKVIVTGATSMVGAALVNACLQQNVGVLAIVRPHTKRLSRLPKSPLLQIQELDLCDLQNISEIKETYDVFYHFAWSHTAKGERNNPLLQNENIQTTLAAVELAHILGCKKFIGAGSQAE